jgi:hypothetical protein
VAMQIGIVQCASPQAKNLRQRIVGKEKF